MNIYVGNLSRDLPEGERRESFAVFGFVEMPNTRHAIYIARMTSHIPDKGQVTDHLELTFVANRPQPCSPHGFHEGRLRVFLSRSPCRRPLRPVLKETSLRLHECGRGERGIFLGFDDQEGARVYRS